MQPTVHYSPDKFPPLDCILCHVNPVLTLTPCSAEVNFNMRLDSAVRPGLSRGTKMGQQINQYPPMGPPDRNLLWSGL
jgi:hypothetical protein